MGAHAGLRRAPVSIVALCSLLLAGCGEPERNEPPLPEIRTAESVARTVTLEAPYAVTPESDDDPESVALAGRVFGSGPTGVILSHMRPTDQTSWFPFATELADSDEFTVLTFDFRGFGGSGGEKQFDRADLDLLTAYRYMSDVLDVDKVFLVGASMGGTASLVVAAREGTAGVVSISSTDQFPELEVLAAIDSVAEPKLFISAVDDLAAVHSLEEMWELAPEPKEQVLYEGDEHGTDLLSGPHANAVESAILRFLRAH
jgi:pimeloyl-ACP methyl ester carboxylesterase